MPTSDPSNGDLPSAAPATLEPTLPELIRKKLSGPGPLPLKDVFKSLPKPPKPKRRKDEPAPPPADLAAEVGRILDDECRAGRAYHYPSGPRGEERFWVMDEWQVLRAAAVEAATEPLAMSAFLTALRKAVKGTDARFAESVVRGLIGEDRLYEYPAKTKAGGPRFGRVVPSPPLDAPKARADLAKLVTSAAKLLKATGAAPGDLLAALAKLLGGSDSPSLLPSTSGSPPPAPVAPEVGPELDGLILKAVGNAGPGSVLSLADLRREMPAKYRGPAFDAAVLRLADDERVRVYQDADPVALTAQERAEYVADEYGNVFKTIAKKR